MEKLRFLLSCKGKMENYINAVTGVGAIAEAAYLPEVDTNFDGLILCGGSDIHPKRFSEEINGSVNIDEDRDAREFALLKAFVEAGKPVLGICRGHQLINIYFGGSLYQDIPEALLHTSGLPTDCAHSVTAVEDSVLAKLYGTEFRVNSSHHQVLKKLGEGIRPTAFWEGKYVEAIEHETLPILSVQWHPERMCFERRREDTVDGRKVFDYFVELCTKVRGY